MFEVLYSDFITAPGKLIPGQPRTQVTFRNESTLVDRGHVVSLYCPDFGQ